MDDMICVEVDITGFYFDEKVIIKKGSTVFDVMKAVRDKTANAEKKLTFSDAVDDPATEKDENRFLRSITVTYTGSAVPRSRQSYTPKKERLFHFADTPQQKITAMEGGQPKEGAAPGALAWQYYVLSKPLSDGSGRVLKNVIGNGNQRRIVPFKDSASANGGIELEDGDRIVWRLVGIFGTDDPTGSANDTEPKMELTGSPKTGNGDAS